MLDNLNMNEKVLRYGHFCEQGPRHREKAAVPVLPKQKCGLTMSGLETSAISGICSPRYVPDETTLRNHLMDARVAARSAKR